MVIDGQRSGRAVEECLGVGHRALYSLLKHAVGLVSLDRFGNAHLCGRLGLGDAFWALDGLRLFGRCLDIKKRCGRRGWLSRAYGVDLVAQSHGSILFDLWCYP